MEKKKRAEEWEKKTVKQKMREWVWKKERKGGRERAGVRGKKENILNYLFLFAF